MTASRSSFRRSSFRRTAASAFAVIASLAIAATALCTSSVSPADGSLTNTSGSYFQIPANPGQVIDQAITIVNDGAEAETFDLAVVDGLTGTGGGVVFALPDAPVAITGSWVKLSANSIKVGAGKTETIPFTVSVPASAVPGHHVAGVSIASRTSGATSAPLASGDVAIGVTIRNRRVIAIEVDVAGSAAPGLTGVSATAGIRPNGVYAEVTLENSGRLFLHPTGTMTVSDPSGKQLLTKTFSLDTFVPATTTVVGVPWSKALPPAGKYPVHVAATDATGASLDWDGVIVIDGAAASAAADRIVGPEGEVAGITGAPDNSGLAILALALGLTVGSIVLVLFLLLARRGRRRERQLLEIMAAERAEDRARTEELLRRLDGSSKG